MTLRQAIKGKQIVTYPINDQPCLSLLTATHLVIRTRSQSRRQRDSVAGRNDTDTPQ
ncbi:hypothetical protein CPB85DRAFT_1329419 [Mucidula mucida]|nr:hypothetical protein CPB85DRAFT_1329419 [Mucidula mucida]